MVEEQVPASTRPRAEMARWIGFFGGPLLAAVVFVCLPPAELTVAARTTVAVAAWMATWWLTEAISITVTALIPITFFPILGARPIAEVAKPYAHRLIFLFLGGFVIGLAMQRWGLHRRIALKILTIVGARPRAMVGGFMFVTAFWSMWMSNTATALLMLPIAISVIALIEGNDRNGREGDGESTTGDNFSICLLLGIAYGATIGGIGTLVGTPPNALLASYVEDSLGVKLSFAQWLVVGLPVVVVFLPIAWLVLCHFVYPIRVSEIKGGAELIREAYKGLGPMKRGEWVTLVVFVMTALAWVASPLLTRIEWLSGLSDSGIAMLAALALFVIPVDIKKREFTMDWTTASRLPWGIIILFGGGLSLAEAIRANGVDKFIGAQVTGLKDVPEIVFILVVVSVVIFLTELTSNFATTATLLPVLASVAQGLDMDPLVLIVPATVAASCAFMMPVATPPNAIVFGSGHLTIPQMAKAGIWLNLIGIALVTILTYTVIMRLL